MKNLLLSVVLLSGFSLFARHRLTGNHNMMRPGDEIVKQQVEYKDPGRSGENVLWDFGKLTSINDEYTVSYGLPPFVTDSLLLMGKDSIPLEEILIHNYVVAREHNTQYYYRYRNDSLVMLGHQNPTVLMHCYVPIFVTPFPIEYGQKHGGNYAAEGLYCERTPLYIHGNNEIVADAYGMMVLPDGDTIRNVLRTKSIQNITEWTAERSDSLFRSTDEAEQDTLRMRVETYRWYVKGYRYPVFETVQTFNTVNGIKTQYFSTAFFYPPREHYYLADDPDNLAELFGDGNEDPLPGLNPNPGDTFDYNFYPNPVSNTLTVEYYIAEPADMTVCLFDMQGILLHNEQKTQQAGIHATDIDMQNYAKGSYVLKITAGETTVSEVIIKK